MNFGWSKEEQMWRRTVRDFAQKKIAPRSREIDSTGHIPEETIHDLAEMGLLAPTVSEEYGGMGMSVTMAAIAAEELGRAEISLALPVLYLVEASWGFIFDRYASPELKKEILPGVTAGKSFLGIAATEPGGGSDIAGATRCKAEPKDGGWLLNGEKMYISGIREELKMGGCHMTLVRTDPGAEHRGFTFFAVPLKDNPCVTTTLVEDWGRQGISTGGFNMENLQLPDKNRIGEANRGFYYAMEGFTFAAHPDRRDLRRRRGGRASDGCGLYQAAQGLWASPGLLSGHLVPGCRALDGYRDCSLADLQGGLDGRRDVCSQRLQAQGSGPGSCHGQAAGAGDGLRDFERGR